MKIGISTACFYNRAVVENALEEVKRLGVNTTECFFASMCEYRAPYIDAIAAAAKGLDIHSVHAMNTQFEPQLFATNPRQLEDAYRIYADFLTAAKRLGASNYTFHGLLKLKKKDVYVHDYDRLSERMNNVCRLAAEHGVTVCHENVHYSNGNEPRYLAEMFRRCPNLGAVLDVKQAVQAGVPYRDYLNVMTGRLHTVHVCDMKGLTTCLPGRGEIDFVRLFGDLYESGFDGAVLLEAYPTDYDGLDELMRSYDYLCDCAEKAK